MSTNRPAPDKSGSPENVGAIFYSHYRATAGSSFSGIVKKAPTWRAKADSWIRHIKKPEN